MVLIICSLVQYPYYYANGTSCLHHSPSCPESSLSRINLLTCFLTKEGEGESLQSHLFLGSCEQKDIAVERETRYGAEHGSPRTCCCCTLIVPSSLILLSSWSSGSHSHNILYVRLVPILSSPSSISVPPSPLFHLLLFTFLHLSPLTTFSSISFLPPCRPTKKRNQNAY